MIVDSFHVQYLRVSMLLKIKINKKFKSKVVFIVLIYATTTVAEVFGVAQTFQSLDFPVACVHQSLVFAVARVHQSLVFRLPVSISL